MNLNKLTLAAVMATFSLAVAVTAAETKLPPASDKKDVTYATDIKPIFDTACVKCHTGDRARARLHMDTLEGVLKGTKDQKIVKVGESDKSHLVKVIAHTAEDQDTWMPPLHNKAGIKDLTPEQIGLIRAWIDQGAK